MSTTDNSFLELQGIAALLESEAGVCQRLSRDLGGEWNSECAQMVGFALSSGIAQIAHCERVLRLAVLQAEMEGACLKA